MNFGRRRFVQLGVGAALSLHVDRLRAQGVSTHTAKPLPRPAASGRPFNAHFVDVAAAAGLHYGNVHYQLYLAYRKLGHSELAQKALARSQGLRRSSLERDQALILGSPQPETEPQ